MTQESKEEDAKTKPERRQSEDAESKLNDQDPGHRQKENQNKQKDDPLAT